MDRTERFYKIELLIRSRGCVSFAVLLDELGVSPATLKRDLDYLRSRMDAPIVYDRLDNGYRLQADARDARQVKHHLPGVWFSAAEIHALLTMHQLVQGLDEGGVLARHLQPLLDKLHGMLGADAAEAESLMRRVKIMSSARRAVAPRHFERVGGALTRRRRLRLRYWVRSRREETERTVSPQRLVHYRNTWYLDAWCHASGGLRRFALDAMRDAEVLEDQPSHDVPVAEVEAALDAGYGAFSGADVQWAELRFAPEAAQWVAHEQWHPQQRVEPHADGSLTLSLPYADDTELAMDLLRHGEQVRVLRPASLAATVAGRLAAGAAQYAAAVPGMPDAGQHDHDATPRKDIAMSHDDKPQRPPAAPARRRPAGTQAKSGQPKSGPVDLASESVAGEEDPGAGLEAIVGRPEADDLPPPRR